MDSKILFPITTILLFSTFLHHFAVSELCDPADKKALLAIKQALNNPKLLSSWDPHSDCCAGWVSTSCDLATNRTDSIFVIESGDLSGPIPPQLADLPHLIDVEFQNQPNLTGPIPRSILKLQKLRYLIITNTSLSGPVPEFLSEIKTLEEIDLSYNDLTGPIPGSLISNLPNLTDLKLHHNRLTGPIPDSLGGFRREKRVSVWLSDNNLSGEIPASLAKTDFWYVDLSRNRLEGDATALLWPNKTGEVVLLSGNSFGFDISKVHKFSRSLSEFDLSHNKISGRLSKGLTSLEHLYRFNVSYNRLCGKIPVGGVLQNLDYTSFFHNRCLCGSPLQNPCDNN